MSSKGRRQAALRETLALFWARSTSKRQNVGPSRAPASCHTCQTVPVHCHMLQETSSLPWVASYPSKAIISFAVSDPPRPGSAKASWVRTSFFFFMQGLISTLSCLCHPNNHLMGSSSPWRSELIISPCVPVHWYLSVGYGHVHQRLRPPWAHQS